MSRGKVRRVFPGGNTSLGFYSFYEYIAKPDANKIIVLKGGPGVGKSSFIRWIGDHLLERGFNVEFHHCAGDSEGIDGIYVPAIDLAIVDGTAPHVIDPRNPGAVDEIIHLGDHWDEEVLRNNKSAILKMTAEASNNFRRAYRYLAIAKLLNDELEGYIQEAQALDIASLNQLANRLVEDLHDKVPFRNRRPYTRHLFASVINHRGYQHYFDTLFHDLKRRIILYGPPGSGRSTLVSKVVDAVQRLGLDLEVFHDVIDPSKMEHVIIPALSTAIVNGSAPHDYSGKKNDLRINTAAYVDYSLLAPYKQQMEEAKKRFDDAIKRSMFFLEMAKQAHDQLESYYVPSMRFDAIEKIRNETLERILRLAADRTRQNGPKSKQKQAGAQTLRDALPQ